MEKNLSTVDILPILLMCRTSAYFIHKYNTVFLMFIRVITNFEEVFVLWQWCCLFFLLVELAITL